MALQAATACSGPDREFGSSSAAGSGGRGGANETSGGAEPKAGAKGNAAGSTLGGSEHGGENPLGTEAGGAEAGGTETGGAGEPLGGSDLGGSDTGGTAGGDAGGGGTTSGKKPLGAQCGNKDQCESNFCVDDVCCESACDGACKACSAAGKCNVKPADDAECGNITCPSDTSCRDYPTAITSNRCAAFGSCKKQADCTFTAKSQGITCDGVHVCDGDGNCGPVVVCGSTASCQIGAKECCAQTDKSIATCLDDGVACAEGPDPAAEDTGMPIECDETTDCPLGNVCCYHVGRGSSRVVCEPAAECLSNSGQMYFEAPVCDSGGGSSPCATGSCKGTVDGVTGWKYCE
jgi:hypothetical protein